MTLADQVEHTLGATHNANRERIARYLEHRGKMILEARAPDRMQLHSGRLPSDIELAEAEFCFRQLKIAADEIRAGFDE